MTNKATELPNIIVVDDHSIFRVGIKLLIEQEGLGLVVAEAENGQQFLELLPKYTPDLVLMDIDMPLLNGIETTKAAMDANPDLRILALSMFGDDKYYVEMINAGARGFVLKSASKSELETAIKVVAKGDNYFSTQLLRSLVASIGEKAAPQGKETQAPLTFKERELEVLQHLSQGASTDEIAEAMSLSPKTIEVYRSKLIAKTNSKNSVSLVIYAIKNGIITI